jgi:hypothetical protein
VRAGGATLSLPVTIQSPSSITLITLASSSTDISAGASTALTGTVYDQGRPAANAAVTFAITDDAGARGSFASSGRASTRRQQRLTARAIRRS